MDLSRRAEAEAMRYSPMARSSPYFVQGLPPRPLLPTPVLVFDATACKKEVAFLARPYCGNVATINRLLSRKEAAVVDRPHLQDIDTVIHVNVDEKEVKDSKTLVLSPVDVTVTEKRRKTKASIALQVRNLC